MMNLKRTYSYISVTLKALEKKKNNKRYFWLIKMYSSGSCYVHIFNLALSVTSVAQSCLTLCDPMDCSMPGFPVHHQLLEFVQTHVHRVSDAIQLLTISSSVVPFSSLLQSFPASGSFPMSWLFASYGQSMSLWVYSCFIFILCFITLNIRPP